MNDIQITLFLEAAKTGNFSLAAGNLNYTQPAFSRHMRELEKELGTKLFQRTNRGVALTESGEILFQLFDEFSHKYRFAIAEIEKLSEKTEIALAVTEGIPYDGLIAQIYTAFSRKHPEYEVKIITDHYFRINEYLKYHQVDIAISHSSALENLSGIEVLPLQSNQLEIAYSESLFPHHRGPVTMDELRGKKHIVYQDNSAYPGYRDYLQQILLSIGLQCEEIQVPNSQTMKSLLYSGRGFTLISEYSAEIKNNPSIRTLPTGASVQLCIASEENIARQGVKKLKKFIMNYYSGETPHLC